MAAFSLQGPETSKVQLLIHGDVGQGYSSPTAVSLAYVITDADGRIVDSQTASARSTRHERRTVAAPGTRLVRAFRLASTN